MFLGGLGLFLLGMSLMSEGLKLAAGSALERILGLWTQTRARGLVAGMLITAMVQSSSAITLATIGFVNAGLLSFSRAVWVLFGANVGTTMTGWLVALIGFKLPIEMLAMPLLGAGMILRLTGENTRRGAIGTAAVGFGALFLGIGFLRDAFLGLDASLMLDGLDGGGPLGIITYAAFGALLTTVMQSSSAALAVTLTAAGGGLITVEAAAAAVVGSNIGTTVTALLAAIGATANARRAAAAHVVFNALTGVVALVVLPWLLQGIEALRGWMELESAPATTLAMFHTAFNVLGVLLMWPLSARLVRALQSRFGGVEEDLGRPRHLDPNTAAVPTIALDALIHELRHLGSIATGMVQSVIATREPRRSVAKDKVAVDRLTIAIGEFAARMNRSSMSHESSERLPAVVRIAHYYDAIAGLAMQTEQQGFTPVQVPPGVDVTLQEFHEGLLRLLARTDTARSDFAEETCESQLEEFEMAYQRQKSDLLRAGVRGDLSVAGMEALLQRISLLRRAAQQAVKAATQLRAVESDTAGAVRRLESADAAPDMPMSSTARTAASTKGSSTT